MFLSIFHKYGLYTSVFVHEYYLHKASNVFPVYHFMNIITNTGYMQSNMKRFVGVFKSHMASGFGNLVNRQCYLALLVDTIQQLNEKMT